MTPSRAKPEGVVRSMSMRANKTLVALLAFLLPVLSRSFIQTRAIALWILVVGILFCATVTSVAVLVAERIEIGRNYARWLIVATMLAFTVAYVFHPSWPGAILLASATTGGAIGLSISRFARCDVQRWVAMPLLAAAAVQAAVIWGQVVSESSWIAALIEPGRTILMTDGVLRPHGLMYHVYEPPALALLAIGAGFAVFPHRRRIRFAFVVGMGMSSSVLALTHSRSALLGFLLLVMVIGAGVFRGHPELTLPLAAVLLAFVIPAALSIGGWTSRLDDSLSSSLDEATLGRLTLMEQAVELAVDYPIVGVGPNRYVEVLDRDFGLDPRYPWIVHSVPLAVAAELGIPAAIAITALLLATSFQSAQVGPHSLALFLAPVGFLAFDVLHYNRPVGLLIFTFWAGLLASLSDQKTYERRLPQDETV